MNSINCIICNSDKNILYKSFKVKQNDTDKKFTLVKCVCNFIYLNPRPDEIEISKYYDNNYLPHSSYRFSLYKFFQKISFYLKYKKIIKLKSNTKNLLDVGGGIGDFTRYLNRKHINAVNYDPYTQDAEIKSINLLNIKQKYDIITMWHSLEHVHNIDKLLSRLHSLLHDNGYLIIALPNQNAYERRKYFVDTWIAYDIPRHLYHFNYTSFNGLMKKYKFKILNFKFLCQDLFFNVYMSNKDQYNSFKLFSILIECLYNIFLDKKKSSSFIFICKK